MDFTEFERAHHTSEGWGWERGGGEGLYVIIKIYICTVFAWNITISNRKGNTLLWSPNEML